MTDLKDATRISKADQTEARRVTMPPGGKDIAKMKKMNN